MTTAARTQGPDAPSYEPSSPSSPSSSKSVAARIGAALQWIGLAAVFACVLELACRTEDWVMYRMPFQSRYASLNDLVIRDADGMHGRPSSSFEKWTMNSLGTRGPETTVIPAPGTVRVITVGASETFGLRESPGREYPRQLEDSIVARVARGECGAGNTPKFEVLNAAWAGMGIPTIDQDIRNRLKRLHPDFIFAYPSPAQYLDDEVPFAAEPDSAAHIVPPPASNALHLRSVDRGREQLKLLAPEWIKTLIRRSKRADEVRSHPRDWQFTSVPSDRVAAFDLDLRRLIGTIRRIGAEPVLATHGNLYMDRTARDAYALVAWEKFYPRATGATIIAFDSVARVTMFRVAADSHVVVVDAAKRLAAAPASAFADFVHFTDIGSSHMADVASAGVIASAQQTGRCGASAGRSQQTTSSVGQGAR